MANIIEQKKVWRISHKIDTAENWKKSNVQLKPGELAFDEHGNFKVGLPDSSNNSWNALPFAGKTKFVSGKTEERPTISTSGDLYTQGDMFKDVDTNKWYFLTGFDRFGEYVWEELTFGSKDSDAIIEQFEEELSKKADAEQVSSLEETVFDILEQLDNKVSKEDLEHSNLDTAIALAEMKDSISAKADKSEVEELRELINNKPDVTNEYITKEEFSTIIQEYSTIENLQNVIEETKEELQQNITNIENTSSELTELIQNKVDVSVLENYATVSSINNIQSQLDTKVDIEKILDESGMIKASVLPGFVDDIIEGVLESDGTFTPLVSTSVVKESGKLYVDISTKKTYRWSGSSYILISESLALGLTSGTALEGSIGKELLDRVDALEKNTSGNKIDVIEQKLDSLILENKEQANDISRLVSDVSNKFSELDELQESIIKSTSDIEYINKELDELESAVKEISDITDSIEDRISSVEDSNNLQNTRLNAIESKVVDQIESIASIETDFENQKEKLSKLQDKVDKVLDIEFPDGESLTLGLMAFKDEVENTDIKSVSISKLTQSEGEEIEFYCGDSSD